MEEKEYYFLPGFLTNMFLSFSLEWILPASKSRIPSTLALIVSSGFCPICPWSSTYMRKKVNFKAALLCFTDATTAQYTLFYSLFIVQSERLNGCCWYLIIAQCCGLFKSRIFDYRKVASSNMCCLEAQDGHEK